MGSHRTDSDVSSDLNTVNAPAWKFWVSRRARREAARRLGLRTDHARLIIPTLLQLGRKRCPEFKNWSYNAIRDYFAWRHEICIALISLADRLDNPEDILPLIIDAATSSTSPDDLRKATIQCIAISGRGCIAERAMALSGIAEETAQASPNDYRAHLRALSLRGLGDLAYRASLVTMAVSKCTNYQATCGHQNLHMPTVIWGAYARAKIEHKTHSCLRLLEMALDVKFESVSGGSTANTDAATIATCLEAIEAARSLGSAARPLVGALRPFAASTIEKIASAAQRTIAELGTGEGEE